MVNARGLSRIGWVWAAAAIGTAALIAGAGMSVAGASVLPQVSLTAEAQALKLKREHTGLLYTTDVKGTVDSVLEYVRERRGSSGPIFQDEEKPDQRVLLDAEGKRWTSETDGGVVELKDDDGRMPFVFETKTEWFKFKDKARMLLSLEALLSIGAKPDYRYGGGHISIRIKGHFEEHPLQFASLVNLALNHEPILVHLMMHRRRIENSKPLTLTRMNAQQLRAAGLPRDSRMTLAQYLGNGLNAILDGSADDCRRDSALKRRYEEEAKPALSVRENCVLAWLSHFGWDVVGDRTYAINLQSWRGAANPIKRHKSLEFRFFNAPMDERETSMEETLVRAMADQAIRAGDAQPIRFADRIDAAYDLDSYFLSYFPDRRVGDFSELLRSSGFDEAGVRAYLDEYVASDERWSARRSRF